MQPNTESSRQWNLRTKRLGYGGYLLGATLAGLLLSGCSLMPRVFDSTTRVINLRETPLNIPCHRGSSETMCTVLLTDDYDTLIIDYKSKCLLLGGSPDNCRTILDKVPE